MRFEKTFPEIPPTQFSKEELERAYDELIPPSRSTSNSAGYDFRCPFDLDVPKGQSASIPLLVKVVGMPPNCVLLLFNRSGLSLKRGLRLDNAVGVIDADYDQCVYFQATAETQDVHIRANDRICQGIFLPFLITDDDDAKGERSGGFGSTGR